MSVTRDLDPKRNHLVSVLSVDSVGSYVAELHRDEKAYPVSKGKIKLMDDVDLEKQLIMTAGGNREDVMGFLCKLMFLMFVVCGCGVLIFYAL